MARLDVLFTSKRKEERILKVLFFVLLAFICRIECIR
jgi:hypothetical protein